MKYIKPPLGLLPRRFWLEERVENIKAAINRYFDAGMPISQEWIDEYNSYCHKDAPLSCNIPPSSIIIPPPPRKK